MSVLEKLAASGQLTPEQVERIGRNVSAFKNEYESNPEFRKQAGFMDLLRGTGEKIRENIVPIAGTALAGMAVGGAIDAGTAAVRSGVGAIQKARAYRAMIDHAPELEEGNPDMTQKAFNTLFRFNPAFAQDPLVASRFVQQAQEDARLNMGDVKGLVDARNKMRSSEMPQGMSAGMSQGLQSGIGSMSRTPSAFENLQKGMQVMETGHKVRDLGSDFSAQEQEEIKRLQGAAMGELQGR